MNSPLDSLHLQFTKWSLGKNPTSKRLNDALIDAAQRGCHKTVPYLLKIGASANALMFDRYSILYRICEKNNNSRMVDILLSHGADVNFICRDMYKSTPLIEAVMNGNTKVVDVLLKYNPDLNLKNHAGFTALDFAYKDQFMDIIKLIEDKKKQLEEIKNVPEAQINVELTEDVFVPRIKLKPAATAAQGGGQIKVTKNA